MKYLICAILFALGSADEKIVITNNMDIKLENLDLEHIQFYSSRDLFQNLKQDLKNVDVSYGGIIAVINDYADMVFKNVQHLILRSGLDPVELPDQVLKLFPIGTISLSDGWLEDTATIARYQNVSVSYSSFTKKMVMVVPIQFNSLMFIYKYHTKILLLNVSGNTQGKITDVRANIKLSFDLKNYQAYLETFDIKDSGSISLTFSGNGLLDWVTSRMTSAVTFFLHPLIIRIIEVIVKGSMDEVVTAINDVINNILHNETVSVDNYLYV